MKLKFIIFLVFLTATTLASNYSLEVDPSTFAFEGYSGHVKYKFDDFEIGLGTYAMTFPKELNSLAVTSENKNLKLKISSAYGIFFDHYLSTSHNSLVVGVQIASQNYALESTSSSMEVKYNSILLMPRVGYKYKFNESSLYLYPWIGIGYLHTSNYNQNIEQMDVKINSILPFATLHVGYEF